MAPQNTSVYGAARPSKPAAASDTTFSTALSSLISTSSSTTKSAPSRPPRKPLPHSNRDSIFTAHNKGSAARSLADQHGQSRSTSSGKGQKHSTSTNTIDGEDWDLSRRHLAKKARLYKAMKRGDLDDEAEKYAVDFDRKWAERGRELQDNRGDDGEAGNRDGSGGNRGLGRVGYDRSESDSTDDDESQGEEDKIEYKDEYGRTRLGTHREAAIALHASRKHSHPNTVDDSMRAHPTAPSQVLYGDTIQASAFDADEFDMNALAGKRDRSATPPEASRYDSKAEIRKRGTGFFAFSKDEEERARQMRELDEERARTEKVRAARVESATGVEGGGAGQAEGGDEKGKTGSSAAERRKLEMEERRKTIEKAREKKLADRFLRDLENGSGAEKGGFVKGAEGL